MISLFYPTSQFSYSLLEILLFPIKEQKYLSEHVVDGEFKVIDSIYGHDGFLLEPEQLTQVIREFYKHTQKKKDNEMVA